MQRRGFLVALAAGTLGLLAACDADPRRHLGKLAPGPLPTDSDNPHLWPTDSVAPLPSASTAVLPPALPDVAGTWSAAPSGRPPSFLNSLPGSGRQVALTVDDGIDSAVVGAYLDFIETTRIRLTFFVNGVNKSWTDHAARLRPMIETGQVQIGNHTWSHPDVTKLSDRAIADEIHLNDKFIANTFGVDARPYFRPPFGFHTARSDRVLADLGYTTETLWYGSLGDSGLLTEDQLMTLARQWLLPQHIVIGHANFPTVTRLFGQLTDLIAERQLQMVTLNDVFTAARPIAPSATR